MPVTLIPMTYANMALFAAVEAGDVAGIKAAIAAGAQLEVKNKDGMTPAHCVPFEDSRKAIPALRTLQQLGADFNAKDNCGATPLHYCMERMDSHHNNSDGGYSNDELREILEIFKDAGTKDNPFDFNPLDNDLAGYGELASPIFRLQHWFVTREHLKILEEFGVRFDLRNAEGKTLAHQWATHADMAGLQFLVAHGISLDVFDNAGNTPLHAFARHEAMVHHSTFPIVMEPEPQQPAALKYPDEPNMPPPPPAPKPINSQLLAFVSLLYAQGVDLDAKNHKGKGKTAVEMLSSSDKPADQALAEELQDAIVECKRCAAEAPAAAAAPLPQVTGPVARLTLVSSAPSPGWAHGGG